MKDLTPTEARLYKYLKEKDGKVTSEQICVYMKWEGKDAINYASRVLHQIEGKGWIDIEPPNLRRRITII